MVIPSSFLEKRLREVLFRTVPDYYGIVCASVRIIMSFSRKDTVVMFGSFIRSTRLLLKEEKAGSFSNGSKSVFVRYSFSLSESGPPGGLSDK